MYCCTSVHIQECPQFQSTVGTLTLLSPLKVWSACTRDRSFKARPELKPQKDNIA